MRPLTPSRLTEVWDLPSLESTRLFGQRLAAVLADAQPGALFLYGDLGAGKTTLTRHIVEHLPGGHTAEVSSPSFTLCNIYYTRPRVHHFDLYRLKPGMIEASLEESLDDSSVLTIVEWPDRIANADLPENGLICRLTGSLPCDGEGRKAELSAIGSQGEHYLRLLRDSGRC